MVYPWTLDNYPYLKRGDETPAEDRSNLDDYRFGITYASDYSYLQPKMMYGMRPPTQSDAGMRQQQQTIQAGPKVTVSKYGPFEFSETPIGKLVCIRSRGLPRCMSQGVFFGILLVIAGIITGIVLLVRKLRR